MYIKPIYLRILCAGLLALAFILARIDVDNEATKKTLSRISTFLFILSFGLYIYFGGMLGDGE